MGWLKFFVISSCIWGSAAYATQTDARMGESLGGISGGERQELHTIQSWTAHLNLYFPGESVRAVVDLNDVSAREAILWELQALELSLRGEAQVEPGSLMHIACRSAACGDGPPDRCIKCSKGRR